MAQADMFLKLTNIKGEALDSKHKDEIEVLSWSFGASQERIGTRGYRVGHRQGFDPGSHHHTLCRSVLDRSFETSNQRQAHRRGHADRPQGRRHRRRIPQAQDGTSHGHSHQQWRRCRTGSGHRKRDPQLPQVHADLHGTGRQGEPQAFLRLHLGYRRVVRVTAASSANATAHAFDFLDVRSTGTRRVGRVPDRANVYRSSADILK